MKILPADSVLLKQCCFCGATFPYLAMQILVSHLQFHIEDKHQRRNDQIECRQRKMRSRKRCNGLTFEIPSQMAIHCSEKHCHSYWVQKQGPEHEVALEQTEQEKNEIISHLSQNDLDDYDVWIYFPQN